MTDALTTTYKAFLREEATQQVAQTYLVLGDLPAVTFDARDLAAALAMPLAEAQEHVDVLLEHELLGEATAAGLLYVPDLVRTHSAATALKDATAEFRSRARRQFWDWLLFATTAAERILTPEHHAQAPNRTYQYMPEQSVPFTDLAGAMTWLGQRQATCIVSIREAAAAGHDPIVYQQTLAAWPMWHRLRPYEDWVATHALAVDAAIRCKDVSAELVLRNTTGVGLRHLDRFEEALAVFEQVRTLAARAQDGRMEAQALHEIGRTQRDLRRPGLGRENLDLSLTRRRMLPDPTRGVALTLLELGLTDMAEDQPSDAITKLSRARVELLAVTDAFNAARALAYLGQAFAKLGDPATAHSMLLDATAEFHHIGERHWAARCAEFRGHIALDQGARADAKSLLDDAIQAYQQCSDRDAKRVRTAVESLTP